MRQSISTKARSALALLYDFERTEIASRTNSSLNAVFRWQVLYPLALYAASASQSGERKSQ
jgi:hypothetical protein